MCLLLLFWVSVFMIFFSYIGYPITLKMMSWIKKKPVKKRYITPETTFIISAHNEESRIKEKIDNTLKLDYPKHYLQIIVVSDGSTDDTNNIVKKDESQGVELIEIPEHIGKEYAQAEAVKRARGEVIVFSDVATRLEENGLREIVANFADPDVGCVSSVDRILPNGEKKIGGEGLYVKYEMWLRAMESKIKTIVGLSGSFFAARQELCQNFSTNMQSDFKTLLNSVKKGLRGISDPLVIGYYHDIQDKSREFNRKVRTVVRGLTVFFNHLEFVNIFKYGMFSYFYVCHKLLRWTVPLFLIIMFITGSFLTKISETYKLMYYAQIAFYLIAFSGISIPKFNTTKLVKIPSFFIMVNVSIIVAWFKYLKGERITLWQSSVR